MVAHVPAEDRISDFYNLYHHAFERLPNRDASVSLLERGLTQFVLDEYFYLSGESRASFRAAHDKWSRSRHVVAQARSKMPQPNLPDTALTTPLPSDSLLWAIQRYTTAFYKEHRIVLPPLSDQFPVLDPATTTYLTKDFRQDVDAHERKLALGVDVHSRLEYQKSTKARLPPSRIKGGTISGFSDTIWINGDRAFDGSALFAVATFLDLMAAHQAKMEPFAVAEPERGATDDQDMMSDDARPRRSKSAPAVAKPLKKAAKIVKPSPKRRKSKAPPKLSTRKQLEELRLREQSAAQTEFESGMVGDDEEDEALSD